jgi:hypothetical protein
MAPTPPTILLVAHHGMAARYLLRTDVFTTLRNAGVRIVIVAPNSDEPYMVEEFGGDEGIALEPLRTAITPRGRLAWALNFLIRSVRRYGVAHGHRSRAFKNRYEGFRARRQGPLARLLGALVHLGVLAAWRAAPVRRAVLRLEELLYTPDLHADIFTRHRPDLVVAASPGIFPADAQLLREARRHGVRTAALILGWDNPTSKGYRGADVDEVMVWSEVMAEQVETFLDIPRERCFVAGVPYFDAYHREDGLPPRAALFERHGLDPDRRLVVFATSSPGLWDLNEPIAETIAQAIEDGALGAPAQLIVRVHPNYLRPGERSHAGYEAIAARHPHVHVDVPEVRSERLRIDRSADDGLWMGALFKHCDVLVNVFSTTTLEAFLLDTPVVLAAEEVGLDGGSAGRGWTEFEHLTALTRYGAGRVAQHLDEIPVLVRQAILDPDADREARRRVAEEECGPLDGRAGERVGRRLLELAGARAPAPPTVVNT